MNQAKISYSVLIKHIPEDCANLFQTIWDQIQLKQDLDNIMSVLNGSSLNEGDLKSVIIKIEKYRNSLALLDQRAIEISNILSGLQEAYRDLDREEGHPTEDTSFENGEGT